VHNSWHILQRALDRPRRLANVIDGRKVPWSPASEISKAQL